MNKWYLDHEIEVNCDEDGETFICYGTKSKRKALQEIRSFAESEFGLNDNCLPKLKDLEVSPVWYGPNEYGEDFYWWDKAPKSARYLGLCWKYEVISH